VHKRFLTILAITILLVFVIAGCGGQAEDKQAEDKGETEKAEKSLDIIFASDHEFSARPDGFPGLEKHYGFEFPEENIQIMDMGLTYKALKDGNVNIAMGFATDGRIKAFDLVNLEDDKHFFPVYNPAPVVRTDTLEKYPEIADVLNPIAEKLDTDTMTTLNMKVDIKEMEPVEVAQEWLEQEGLLPDKMVDGGKVAVGSKEFTEQLILGQITILALESAGFEVKDKTNLAGTEAVRKALETGEIDLYWEYTGTAWLVHLGHDQALTESKECYDKVKEEDSKNGFTWLDYAPFNNTYTIMMRRAEAEKLGIKSLSDLAKYINENS
jgi:osmoprotectant transport system permease protein